MATEDKVLAQLVMDRAEPIGNYPDTEFPTRRNLGVTVRELTAEIKDFIARGFNTGANTRPTVTSTSSVVLAANPDRKYAYFINNGSGTVYLKLGATASINQGIPIPSNAIYEITWVNLWTGSVSAIKSGAAGNLDVFEGV